MPVVTYFESQSRLQRISADGGSIDAVFADIEKVFAGIATKKSLPRRLAGKFWREIIQILRRS
jgi:hypothetical protein